MMCSKKATKKDQVVKMHQHDEEEDDDQGRSQEVDFFIVRGANHTKLYKNLIKI